MSNPSITRIKEGRVECVARNVLSGIINRSHKNKATGKFLCSYRTAGEAQPSHAQMLLEGVELFTDTTQATISSESEIDVHMVYINGSDSGEWGEVIIWT